MGMSTAESKNSSSTMELPASSSSCPFSVEVTVSDDCHLDLISSQTSNSLSDCIIHDDAEPALVPIGSCAGSDSDTSSQEDKASFEDGHNIINNTSIISDNAQEETSTEVTQPMPIHVKATSDEVGMIECLSDQFSNMFCSSDHHGAIYRCSMDTTTASDPYHVGPTCGVLDATSPGSEVFASLNFWLSPSDEEKLADTDGRLPRNRVCARSHKTTYVKRLYNHWHPDNIVPLERSKSMPDEPSLSIQDLQFDVFYDSDPESEHTERTARGKEMVKPKPEPRRSFRSRRPPPIETIYEEECTLDFTKPPSAPRNSRHLSPSHHGALPSEGDTTISINSSRTVLPGSPRSLNDYHLLHHQGDEFLRQYVHEITNARINMVWHRLPSKGVKRPIQAPVAVTGAFEVGAHLDQIVIQPKFTWSPAYEADLQKRKFSLSGGEPHSVELLSIIRVVKPTSLNRELYPFARLDRTCCVSTNDERFPYLVFEASSPRERDWLVTALKMIVARLASIIIVRDEARLLEFFSPYSAIMSLADGDGDEELEDGHPPLPPTGPPPPLHSQGEGRLLSY